MKKLLLIVLIIIGSCSKSVDEDPNEGALAMPSETLRFGLGQVFNVTENTVSLSSDVAAFVESDIVEKGFCWSVDNGIPETPSISDNILPASFFEKSDALVYTEDGQNVFIIFLLRYQVLLMILLIFLDLMLSIRKGKFFMGPLIVLILLKLRTI